MLFEMKLRADLEVIRYLVFLLFMGCSASPLSMSPSPFSSNDDVYEFCANNEVFSFSREACPGGVLLKEPMLLSEPCKCINKHLTVYTICSSVDDHDGNLTGPVPTKTCQKGLEGNEESPVLVKFIQPSGSGLGNMKKFRYSDVACQSENELTCLRYPENRFPVEWRHKASSYENGTSRAKLAKVTNLHEDVRRGKRVKRDLNTNLSSSALGHITDERLRKRIEDTISFLYNLQFGSDDGFKMEPKSMSFKVLVKTTKIYNNIAPSVIIEDETLDSILTLFLDKYSDLELPGYSGKLMVDDNIIKEHYDEVMAKLNECYSRSRDSSQELEFLSTPNLCPAEVTHVIYKAKTQDFGFRRIKRELGKSMPKNRFYVPEREDFVLGALWKVFDAVFSYCFPYLFTYQNARILINYHNIMENIFVSPIVYPDYNTDKGTSMYSTRIEHEDLSVLMRNIDLMDEAVHIISKFKPFFLKPLSSVGGGGSGPRIAPASGKTKDNQKSKGQKRQKRSTTDLGKVNWNDLEIWEGQAYCLQLTDSKIPPSLANVYPNIDDLLCAI